MADEKDAQVTDSQQTDDVKPSDKDSATSEATGVETTSDTPEAEGTETADDDPSDLLTPEERKAIEKMDPDERVKGFERAYIKKTQQLADQRKELGSWLDLKQAYEEDKVGTLIDIARRHGLEVKDPREASTKEQTVDLSAKITEVVKQGLGPEYEDLADKLAPAILEAAKAVVAETTKPLQQRQEELIAESAVRESGALIAAFEKTHPDLKDHLGRMNEIAETIQPAIDPKTGRPRLTEEQFLELLYNQAKPKEAQVAEAAKKAVKKMEKSAAAASKDAPGVSADKVSTRTDGPISMDRAYELAKQGVVVGR